MRAAASVVPICSAIGFAYVLKLTGCDQHLVQFLLRPFQWFRLHQWLHHRPWFRQCQWLHHLHQWLP